MLSALPERRLSKRSPRLSLDTPNLLTKIIPTKIR